MDNKKSDSKSCWFLRIGIFVLLASTIWILFTEKLVSNSLSVGLLQVFKAVKLEEEFQPVTTASTSISYMTALPNDVIGTIQKGSVTAALDNKGLNSVQVLSNASRVFYNRVSKCGSRTTLRVMEKLSARNSIHNHHSQIYNLKKVNEGQEADFVDDFMSQETPLFYDRHLYFVDFKQHGEDMPIYINLIRDPFERLLSRHYFILYESKRTPQATREAFNMTFTECVEQNLSICMSPANLIELVTYFCGQAEHCESNEKKNNAMILSRAKTHVTKYYAAVGILEEAEDFFFLIEQRIPHFFKGALRVYQDIVPKMREKYENRMKIQPSEKIKLRVQAQMQEAYDFYNFVKQRQYNMLAALGKKPTIPPKSIV